MSRGEFEAIICHFEFQEMIAQYNISHLQFLPPAAAIGAGENA